MANRQVIGLEAVLDTSNYQQGMQTYINGLRRMEQETNRMAGVVGQTSRVAENGIGVAIGVGAVQAVDALIGRLQSLSGQVLDTLKFFESLQFSLETIFAVQAVNADASLAMADALDQSADAAKSYLLYLQDLAIYSPFTTEEIGAANRTLQIYGFLGDEAAGLTKLLIDIASVGGIGAERLQRVALATGQILAENRLLARDALQLTQAGVPILQFIAKETGMTFAEIQTAMRKGQLSSKIAIEAMVEGLLDFEGAGKRVTNTAQGLLSSLEDIRQITTRDLFAGVFEGVRPLLQEIVQIGSSTEFRASMVAIGEVIGKRFGDAIKTANAAVRTFISIIGFMPSSLIKAGAAFGVAVTALLAFSGAIGLTTVAINLMITPFTLVIGAVGSFAALYVAGMTRIQGATQNTNQEIIKRFQVLIEMFGQVGVAPAGVVTAMRDMATGVGNAGEIVVRVVDAISESALRATEFLARLANQVVTYGANIAGSFGKGMAGGLDFIFSGLNLMGGAITGMLKPGSPPKLLPDLEKWGTETAQVWINSWNEADFGQLRQITGTIRDILGALADKGDIDQVTAVRLVMGSRQEIANAINEINRFGDVSESTLNRVARAAGPAGEQVRQILSAYVDVARTTQEVERAQAELDRITEHYTAILKPLRQELERISEIRQRGDEEDEILSLQRTIANQAASATAKSRAQARINEILQERRVRGLEREEDVQTDLVKTQLDAAKQAQDAARATLDLVYDRIGAQTDSLKLYGEELKAIEALRREQERLAREAREKALEPYERQLKIYQLVSQEVSDTVQQFKNQYILNDANSTEIEKQNALLDSMGVAGRRMRRNFDAVELGIPQDYLDMLRQVNVVLEDIGVKGKGDEDLFGDPDLSAIAEQTDNLLEEFNKNVELAKQNMTLIKQEFFLFTDALDKVLPPFLRFRDETKTFSPLLETFKAAFAGVAVTIASERFLAVLTALPQMLLGMSNPLTLLTTASGFLAAAWIGDWFNMRDRTATVINEITNRINAFNEGGGIASLFPTAHSEAVNETASTIEARFSLMSRIIQGYLVDGLSADEFLSSLTIIKNTFKSAFLDIAKLDFMEPVINRIKLGLAILQDPQLVRALVSEFGLNLKKFFTEGVQQAVTEGMSLRALFLTVIYGWIRDFAINWPLFVASFIDRINDLLIEGRPALDNGLRTLFSDVIPAALVYFGYALGAIMPSIGRLLRTQMDILFESVIPAILNGVPRMIGGLLIGFRIGINQVGGDMREALTSLALILGSVLGLGIVRNFAAFFDDALGGMRRRMAYGFGHFLDDLARGALIQFGNALTDNFIVNGIRGNLDLIGKAFALTFKGIGLAVIALERLLSAAGGRVLGIFMQMLGGVRTFAAGAATALGGGILRAINFIIQGTLRILSNILWLRSSGYIALRILGRSWFRLAMFIGEALDRTANFIRFISGVATAAFRGYIAWVVRTADRIDDFGRLFYRVRNLMVSANLGGTMGTTIAQIGRWITVGVTQLNSYALSFARWSNELGIAILSHQGWLNFMAARTTAVMGTIASAIGTTIQRLPQMFGGLARILPTIISQFDSLLRSLGSRALLNLDAMLPTLIAGFQNAGRAIQYAFANPLRASFDILGRLFLPLVEGTYNTLRRVFATGIPQTVGRGLRNAGSLILGFTDELSRMALTASRIDFGAAIGRAFGALSRGGGGIASRIGGLFGGINFASIASGFGKIAAVLRGLGPVLRTVFSPLNVLIAGVEFFGFAFSNNIDGVENRAVNFVMGLRQAWADLISGKLINDMVSGFTKAFRVLRIMWDEFQSNGIDSPKLQFMLYAVGRLIWNWIKETANGIWIDIREFWAPMFWQWISGAASSMVNTLKIVLIALRDWIAIAGGAIYSLIVDQWIPAFTLWWGEGGGQLQTMTMLSNISTTITNWIVGTATWIYDNFIMNWLPAFSTWITESGPTVLANLATWLLGIVVWLAQQIPVFIDTFLGWTAAFINWFGPVIGWTLENLGLWIGKILEWVIGTGIPMLIGGVVGLAQALIGWITGGENSAESQAPSGLQRFLTALLNFITSIILPALWSAGVSIAQGLWNGVKTLWQTVLDTEFAQSIGQFPAKALQSAISWINTGATLAANFIDSIIAKIGERIKEVIVQIGEILVLLGSPNEILQWALVAGDLGKELVMGLAQGIVDWMFWPVEKLREGITGMLTSAKEWLEIGSPSKLFQREIGDPIPQGIAAALENADFGGQIENMTSNILGFFGVMRDDSTAETDEMGEESAGLLGDMSKGSLKIVDNLVSKGSELFVTFREATVETVRLLGEDVMGLVDNLFEVVISKVGVGMEGINTALDTAYPLILTDLQEFRKDFVFEFSETKRLAAEQVDLMTLELVKIFVTNEDSLLNQLREALIGEEQTGIAAMIGYDFINGIATSVTDNQELLVTAVTNAMTAALQAAATTLETGSPSRAAARIAGKPFTEGVAMGMLEALPMITAAAKTIASQALGASVGGFSAPFQPRAATFLPSNVSNVQRTSNYNLTVQTARNSQGVVNDFGVMKAWAGGY